MKKVAFLCALAFLLTWACWAAAADVQTVNLPISKLNKNYAFKTDWGNIYFGERDLHKLIHGAAHLRPIALGTFQTDQGAYVAVKTLGYDKGVVTIAITNEAAPSKAPKPAKKK
jgi:hypothetical protein